MRRRTDEMNQNDRQFLAGIVSALDNAKALDAWHIVDNVMESIERALGTVPKEG